MEKRVGLGWRDGGEGWVGDGSGVGAGGGAGVRGGAGGADSVALLLGLVEANALARMLWGWC